MLRLNPTLRSIGVLISLLIVCLIGITILRAKLKPPIVTGGNPPVVNIDWDISAAEVDRISFSGSSRHICTISETGQITCYDRGGDVVFSTLVDGADRAVTTPDGECTLAYAHRNPANTKLTFLDSAGKICWTMNMPSAVWSADADSSNGVAEFAVGAGESRIYMVSVNKKTKRYRRFRTPGVVCSVALDSAADTILYGTWQPSTLRATHLDGRTRWEVGADSSMLQYVEPLAGSARMLLNSVPNRFGADSETTLREPDGKSLSRYTVSVEEATRVIPSPNGLFVCVGYRKLIQHSGKTMPEKHTVLYDYAGRKFWDKGSMLLQATPILVLNTGFVLISDGEKTIFAVGPDGAFKQVCELTSPISRFTRSPDSCQAMVECQNGRIYHLDIQ